MPMLFNVGDGEGGLGKAVDGCVHAVSAGGEGRGVAS